MSQHDFEITKAEANQGITFRAAVNSALQALATNSSETTAPETTYPFQFWADTTNNLLKMRNGLNTTWIIIGLLDTANFGLSSLASTNEFTASQKLKGGSLLLRFLDTNSTEYGIRSISGKLQIVENTGTEITPVWTPRLSIGDALDTMQGADIASAGTTNIGAATGNFINVTGNVNISSFGTADAGIYRIVTFTGSPTLVYNASLLILPGLASIGAQPGDTGIFLSLGAGVWKCITYSTYIAAASATNIVPLGGYIHMSGPTVPSGYLECNGATLSLTTYSALFAYWGGPIYGRGTGVLCTAGTADVITKSNHGLNNGDRVIFTASVMPGGLSSTIAYYVIEKAVDTFKVSLTEGGGQVDITSSGTSVYYYTQFNLPNLRGIFLRGWDHARGVDPDRAGRVDRGDGVGGDYVGTYEYSQYYSHAHSGYTDAQGSHQHGYYDYYSDTQTYAGYEGPASRNNVNLYRVTDAAGSHAHNVTTYAAGGNETRPVNINSMICIKY